MNESTYQLSFDAWIGRNVAILLCLLIFSSCAVEFESRYDTDPSGLGSPFDIVEKATEVTAGQAPDGITWLHCSIVSPPKELQENFEKRLSSEQWEIISRPGLNCWIPWQFRESGEFHSQPGLFLKAAWLNSTSGAVFTYNLSVKGLISSETDLEIPTLIKIEQILYPKDEAEEFRIGLNGWNSHLQEVSIGGTDAIETE